MCDSGNDAGQYGISPELSKQRNEHDDRDVAVVATVVDVAMVSPAAMEVLIFPSNHDSDLPDLDVSISENFSRELQMVYTTS